MVTRTKWRARGGCGDFEQSEHAHAATSKATTPHDRRRSELPPPCSIAAFYRSVSTAWRPAKPALGRRLQVRDNPGGPMVVRADSRESRRWIAARTPRRLHRKLLDTLVDRCYKAAAHSRSSINSRQPGEGGSTVCPW